MSEVWKPVVGFEGLYEVSDQGRVRSLDRYVETRNRWGAMRRFQPGRVLKYRTDTAGYVIVALLRDGVLKSTSTHILVAAAFIGPRPEGMEVCHNDGSKTNSRVENLRYATASENAADKHKHGTAVFGELSPRAILTEHDIKEIRAAEGVTLAALAAKYGCVFSNIAAIRARKTWKHV